MRSDNAVIDFAHMTPQMTKDFNSIAEGYKKKYTEFIDALSLSYGNEKFWWDTPLASRNIYLCNCFQEICLLKMALKMIDEGNISHVTVPSEALKRSIIKNLQGRPVKVISGNPGRSIKKWMQQNISFYSWWVQRSLKKTVRFIRENMGHARDVGGGIRETTFVSTYVEAVEFAEGTFHNRYFPGLKEHAEEDIVFLADLAYSNDGEGKNLTSHLSGRTDIIVYHQFAEKEDFKVVKEYCDWCLKVKIKKSMFDGMDVTDLLEDAIRKGAVNINAMNGLLKAEVESAWLSSME